VLIGAPICYGCNGGLYPIQDGCVIPFPLYVGVRHMGTHVRHAGTSCSKCHGTPLCLLLGFNVDPWR
jgi:hypothetical protein